MAARKYRKRKVSTLLIVGEGAHDRAFLSHMKGLYDTRANGQKVKLDAADGGSPRDIINAVARKYKHAGFDKRYILLDSDISPERSDFRAAERERIELIFSIPLCLEGFLLTVLGEKVGESSAKALKASLHPRLGGPPTDKRSYGVLFGDEVLSASEHETIKLLISLFKNEP